MGGAGGSAAAAAPEENASKRPRPTEAAGATDERSSDHEVDDPCEDADCGGEAAPAPEARQRRAYAEKKDFWIVQRECGSERDDLPIFTTAPGLIRFTGEDRKEAVWREDIESVPGAFLLHNVLTDEECDQIIAASEAMGYTEDAPVSLGRHIRHNENCVWIADDELTGVPFNRCQSHFPPKVAAGVPVGLNARWRLYKYNTDDVFKVHTDGSWPGSGLDSSGRLVKDIYGDRWSQLTWVLYLNDNFDGGSTRFYLQQGRGNTYSVHDVQAVRGSAMCFFHGEHELSHLHEGAQVTRGTKYIIRSDVLYTLRSAGTQAGWRMRYSCK